MVIDGRNFESHNIKLQLFNNMKKIDKDKSCVLGPSVKSIIFGKMHANITQ